MAVKLKQIWSENPKGVSFSLVGYCYYFILVTFLDQPFANHLEGYHASEPLSYYGGAYDPIF